MTNGEFVSSFLNDGKLLSKDLHISRRFILNKARMIVSTYLAQRLDASTISFQGDLITTIDCVELLPVERVECSLVDITNCANIMKSKYKLPKILNGRLGYAVLSVTSLDEEYEFKYISSSKFKNKMKNKYVRDKEKYFMIDDDYLILPNSEVEFVKIKIITLHKEDVKSDCGCNDSSEDTGCKTVWEEDFICPENILSMVRDKVAQELAQLVLQVTPDENPNLDANQRTQTVA